MEKSNSTPGTGKIIGAAFFGALIGAGLVILITPKSGQKTLKKSRSRSPRFEDSIANKNEIFIGE